MIINSRKDLDAAPVGVREQFIQRLATGLYHWTWTGGDWTLVPDAATIHRFGFELTDFPDAPVPEKPDYNPDEKRREARRRGASLSRAHFKLALLKAGYLDAIEAAYPQWPREVQIMYDDSGSFERMHPSLLQLAEIMGYSEVELDALFGIEAPINVNVASVEQLQTLPGVGASLADQIVRGRPWQSLDDLTSIRGISQTMVDSWLATI